MPKVSAGLLLYRRRGTAMEVLLVHPGGPFWKNKDLGAWSIPKGEVEPDEDLLAAAVREVHEELGLRIDGDFTPLSPVKQSGKIVHAWAAEFHGNLDAIVSNMFRMEFPPRSGRFAEFPEVDRAEWFEPAAAREKILPSQRPLIDEFCDTIVSRRRFGGGG